MKKFLLIANSAQDPGNVCRDRAVAYLEARGAECSIAEYVPTSETGEPEHYEIQDRAGEAGCAIVLGGDGTLLMAVRQLYDYGIPVMGINTGSLGYLTAAGKADLPGCLDCLLDDTYEIEERMMIHGSVRRHGELVLRDRALNDIVVTCKGYARLVEFKVYVNDELINIFAADGVIVSTPTGSTGYNLSAGGPVVTARAANIILTPICPHSLSVRSMVLTEDDRIRIEIGRRHKSMREEALVTFDGKASAVIEPMDDIRVMRAYEKARLVKLPGSRNFRLPQEIGSELT
ncbi:MAG: NAD(+)/NADH kinase [Lachnospiraceae bacterium]|nr:NAD(+)/NADH kinase [Lachnospiraceae bacterium]